MTKKVRNISLAVMSAIVLAFVFFAVSILAADTNAHFTFTNVYETQPDLYVTKSVSSALDGYTVPDTEFTFTLKWDRDGDGYLEFADSVYYFLYDGTGTQIKNPDTSDGSFRTSSTGKFTLKDGQYVYFEWAGQIEYEITEESAENFTQTVPAGGSSATGTISADGTVVNFENMYVPVDTTSEETMLAIRKDVSWPDGYDVPDSLDTDFTFEVRIDGSPYSGEPYIVYNSDMTEELDRDYTDSNGRLSLKYGQVALFETIDVGVDYEVTEVDLSEGWRVVSNDEYHGSTTAPIIYAYFTNEGTSFIVEKDRSDGITGLDDEFTFVLADENRTPMTGILYYVYDSQGHLIMDEDDNIVARTTDSDGKFTLKAGERAVFLGIAENNGYSVTEVQPEGYEMTPEDGYTDESVSYGSPDDLVFVNTQLSNVTIKKAEANNMNNLLPGAEFTVYVKDDSGEYMVVDVQTTGDDGTLTFKNLPAGDYKIEETKAPDGYMITGSPIEVTLPYTMTETEISRQNVDVDSEEFTGLYNSKDGVYYFYNLTYDVTNNRNLMELPNAGGFQWILVVLGVMIVAVTAFASYRYRRKKTVISSVQNHDGGIQR